MKAVTIIKKQATTNIIDAKEIFENVKTEILDGKADPAKVFTFFHQMAEVFELIKADSQIKDSAEKEIKKHGKEMQMNGFTLKVTDRKKYDFSACGDPYINTLYVRKKLIENSIKEREEFLKLVDNPMADEKSEGAILEPPTVYLMPIISISRKKAA